MSSQSIPRIILLGAPGAGKGTQSLLITRKLSIPHISTGDIMRAAVSSGSELGLQVKEFLDGGKLVPDDIILKVMAARLAESDCARGYLLDGFPRTVEQAKQLGALLKSAGQPLSHVVNIVVPEPILLERIRKRGESGSGRSDDDVAVAARRLAVFWEQTAPVVQYYKNIGNIHDIDGLGTVEEVQARIFNVLGV